MKKLHCYGVIELRDFFGVYCELESVTVAIQKFEFDASKMVQGTAFSLFVSHIDDPLTGR